MKIRHIGSVFLILWMSLHPGLLFGATFVGNAADKKGLLKRTVWFVGQSRTVNWCFFYSSDSFNTFGFRDVIAEQFVLAVKKWENYTNEKRIFVRLDPSQRPSFRFEQQKECDGKEDLIIYLGYEHMQEIKDLKKYYENPVAIAHRTALDERSGWSKGLIWLKDTEAFLNDDPRNIYAAFLHELGHIFGNSHVDGTIMRADIEKDFLPTQKQELSPEYYELKLTQIDQNRELYSCTSCSISISGYIKDSLWPEIQEFTKAVFSGESNGSGSLKIYTDGSEREFTLSDLKLQNQFSFGGIELFKIVVGDFNTSWNSYGSIWSAHLRFAKDRVQPVLIHRNQGGLIEIMYFEGLSYKKLFIGNTIN